MNLSFAAREDGSELAQMGSLNVALICEPGPWLERPSVISPPKRVAALLANVKPKAVSVPLRSIFS